MKRLMESKDGISFRKISEEIRCSVPTVRTYLMSLSVDWIGKVYFDFSKRGSVTLSNDRGVKFISVFSKIFANSQNFKIIQYLFFQSFKTLEALKSPLHMNESGIYRAFDKINALSEDIGFSIKIKSMTLVGDSESVLRMQLVSVFEQAYLDGGWPFVEIDKHKIVDLIFEIGENFSIPMSYRVINRMAIITAITFYRIKQGFNLENHFLNTEDDKYELYLLKRKGAYQDAVMFPLDSMWYKELARFIFVIHYGWESDDERQQTVDEIMNFLNLLSAKLNFSIQPKEKESILMEFIYLYLEYRNQPKFRSTIQRDYCKNVERVMKRYLFFAKEVTYQLKQLERKMKFPWYSVLNYESIWALIVGWTDLILLLSRNRPKVNIFVISSQGSSHSKMLSKLFRGRFSEGVKIKNSRHIYMEHDYKKLLKDASDSHIVVSTNDYSIISSDRMIVIDEIPSKEQIQLLEEKIEILRNELWFYCIAEQQQNVR
jgi:hypothetical protein